MITAPKNARIESYKRLISRTGANTERPRDDRPLKHEGFGIRRARATHFGLIRGRRLAGWQAGTVVSTALLLRYYSAITALVVGSLPPPKNARIQSRGPS